MGIRKSWMKKNTGLRIQNSWKVIEEWLENSNNKSLKGKKVKDPSHQVLEEQ